MTARKTAYEEHMYVHHGVQVAANGSADYAFAVQITLKRFGSSFVAQAFGFKKNIKRTPWA